MYSTMTTVDFHIYLLAVLTVNPEFSSQGEKKGFFCIYNKIMDVN